MAVETVPPGLDQRARDVDERTRTMLEPGGPNADVSGLNALAAELAAVCAELHTTLRATAARDPAAAAEHCETLTRLTGLQGDLREHVIGLRFGALARIHEGLGRLRAEPSVAGLLPAAVRELGVCCDFDRCVISQLRGSEWRAEAVWARDATQTGPGRPAGPSGDVVTGDWVPLGRGTLETDLVRRRAAALVAPGDPRSEPQRAGGPGTGAYVAAPVMPAGQVIGFLQADCHGSGRELTTLDRDNLWTFAEGFGLVFERTALLERLEQQRVRVHDAFAAAEEQLSGLSTAETRLIRRERETSAPPATAGLFAGGGGSPVDQLLTAREREVLELMVTGARNSQIADSLVISDETVKSHVRTISRKLRASSRADAVSRYLRLMMRERR